MIKGEVAIDCVDVELFLSRDNNFGKARIEDHASPKRVRARERGRDRDQREWEMGIRLKQGLERHS